MNDRSGFRRQQAAEPTRVSPPQAFYLGIAAVPKGEPEVRVTPVSLLRAAAVLAGGFGLGRGRFGLRLRRGPGGLAAAGQLARDAGDRR